ncbi:calmodulin-binding transcription activator 2-like isoform X2 [Henckelia pumila]|uniref:calmodulin-binding transcription activator 2-like isoform X2 n=1 Tax=Henckelia pumila TaxID=405737 RepID=UPI003C6E33E1
MAGSGSHGLGFQLDINQILSEAQHRWLRPAEICEILRNYLKFRVSTEAPNNPVSGSTFLFDRKVLRYFRKDGHNWRKKKDGKTVKEAHEKLKVGSIDMLHCYYAHGEDNENFQRRSYWLLEPDLMHIVFVHYLEVKGGKLNTNYVRNMDTALSTSENDSMFSPTLHGASPTSTLSSANEDAESEDNHQASSRFHSYPESPLGDSSHSTLSSSYGNWDVSSPNYAAHFRGHRDVSGGSKFVSSFQPTLDLAPVQEASGKYTAGELIDKEESVCYVPVQANVEENNMDPLCNHPGEHKDQSEQRNLQAVPTEMEIRSAVNPNLENIKDTVGNENYSFLLKKPLINSLQMDGSLKKADSFTRWMANELGEADELDILSSNRLSWSIMGSDYESNISAQLEVDADSLSSSILGDQLFSIIDVSPNWTYPNWECKVLITGKFLKSELDFSKCKWSIMFGEMEIPTEVLADGILCSHAPLHKPGTVPFYVTCSNRLACSEIREFEYRRGHDQNIDATDVNEGVVTGMHLYRRLEMLLCQIPIGSPIGFTENDLEKQTLMQKIVSLMEENCHDAKLAEKNSAARLMVTGEVLLEKQLKEKFYYWLLQRLSEEDVVPIVVDDRGQGVLHLAAALGFNWVFQPIIIPGVSLDFRDVNGWTALHWAAFYGREDTVAALVSLGAAPGALTDPSAEHPLGRTPADLASSSGHKGISGFLAETFLTTHLTTLRMNDPDEDGRPEVSGRNAIHTVSERLAVPTTEEEVPDTLSLKDSLAAVCNASQAAARIHQIFRIQSFQRKQFTEQGCDELLSSDERAISLVTGRSSKLGVANAAAVHIQKKFRGWKKRKEFLQIRQKVVKIQAHVRGHQARMKHNKSIMWPVGILEKVILRWRRKGRGFRGFGSDVVQDGPNIHDTRLPEDDYDVLKEGRRQTEERMQKALARVKSMAQYPEARAQYRRLLTAAEGFRETKAGSDEIPDNIEEDMGIYAEGEMLDIESLLDDDTFMSLAFQ